MHFWLVLQFFWPENAEISITGTFNSQNQLLIVIFIGRKTQDSSTVTKRMRITSSVTKKDGVRMMVVNCLSFCSCQTTNYALLKFLDVNRVNVVCSPFTCLLHSD